jgi:hypothetical protein
LKPQILKDHRAFASLMRNTIFFGECTDDDAASVGKKALNVASLFKKGFKVPPGFIISRNVFDTMALDKNVKSAVSSFLKDRSDAGSQKLMDLIRSYEFPESIADEIIEAYLSISVDLTMNAASLLETRQVYVAVRGSVIGQGGLPELHQKTTLNIKGKDRLFKTILDNFAVTYTEAISKSSAPLTDFSMSLIVQKMINAEKSGIASQEDGKTVIKACFGLGEGMLSDRVFPDTYMVKDNLVLTRDISDKKFEYVRDIDTHETVIQELGEKSSKQVLYDDEAIEIASAVRKIDDSFGRRHVIEWSKRGQALYILQAKDPEALHRESVEMEVFEETSPPDVVDISEIDEDIKALEEIEAMEKVESDERIMINDMEGTPMQMAEDMQASEEFIQPAHDYGERQPSPVMDVQGASAGNRYKELALLNAGNVIVYCHMLIHHQSQERLKQYGTKVPDTFADAFAELSRLEEIDNNKEILQLEASRQEFVTKGVCPKPDDIMIALKLLGKGDYL